MQLGMKDYTSEVKTWFFIKFSLKRDGGGGGARIMEVLPSP